MEKQNGGMSSVVIPIGGAATGKAGRRFPHLLDAISQIQQFYVIEVTGQEIPEDFLTVRGTLNFFNVGFGAGFLESLLFIFLTVLLLPVMNSPQAMAWLGKYIPLLQFKFFLYLLDLMPIIVSGGLCCFLSKYYVGRITKKAINSLLCGRLFSMLIKGLIFFVVLIFFSGYITPHRAAFVASLPVLRSHYYAVYYLIMRLKPAMIRTAFMTLIVFAVAIAMPFIFVWGVAWWRRVKVKRTEKKVLG